MRGAGGRLLRWVHGLVLATLLVIIEHRRLSTGAGRATRCAASALADHGLALVHHVVLIFAF